jgi:hypothetical protein
VIQNLDAIDDVTLLVRNIRGNWSIRLLHEYFYRRKNEGHFYYLNMINLEVFPPHRYAPWIISSSAREWIVSKFFFKNPLPDRLVSSLIKSGVEKISYRWKLSTKSFLVIWRLFSCKNASDLDALNYRAVLYGRFLHTTLIAKYGTKHFELTFYKHFVNIPIYLRYFSAYERINKLISDLKISRIVLINGRDAVGVAAQLAAYTHNVAIFTLERGFGLSEVPLYGEWRGNMHHWRVREDELIKTMESHKDFEMARGREFISQKYGGDSKWWKIGDNRDTDLFTLPSRYATFFTTSERETTCCPTGIPLNNLFDEFDQIEQLRRVYASAQLAQVHLVIRMHPNFTGSTSAANELAYFKELVGGWNNVTLIPNTSNFDSYQLIKDSICVFTFRSSLSAELSLAGVQCIQTASTAWTKLSDGQPIIETEDMVHLISGDIPIKNTASNDWYGFAAYNSLHGREFESIQVTADPRTKTRIIHVLNGTSLDLPRFKFKLARN